MNIPAIAKQTFDLLRSQQAFSNITDFVMLHLKKISSPFERARFVHDVIDKYNLEVFSHPLVKELSPCKKGCVGCCYTQVSITEDEAQLLSLKTKDGVKINHALLQRQMKAGNNADDFYKLSFESRRCIFLGVDNLCQVYEDRPAVCRTNAVLGKASQCSTENGVKQELRLVKTPHADMAIMGAFLASHNNGTLAFMVGKIISRPDFKKN